MAVKVSKNLRRLRKAQNKTQEQLAAELHVTRQAISNWENDKTQPDLESLLLLAKIFHVEIEELIYGEKRQVGTEVDPDRASAKVRIVLGVVGAVFVGVGLVLIFLNFWQDFPLSLQTVFSVLPLLFGQAFAVYVFCKRQDEVVWRECGAILWCIGIISTIALINSVFDIHCGFQNCLLIDIVLCLPVFYLLRAVSPIVFYFYMVIHWAVLSESLLLSGVLLLAGLLYVFVFRKNREDVRYKYTVWVSAIGAVAFGIAQILVQLTDYDWIVIPILLVPFLLIYLVGGKDTDLSFPFKPLGVTGCAAILTVFSVFVLETTPSLTKWNTSVLSVTNGKAFYIGCLVLLIAVLGTAAIRFRTFADNLPKILLSAFAFGAVLSSVIAYVTDLHALLWLACICAVGFGGTLIYTGLDNLKLMPANLGLLMLFVQLIFLLTSMDLSPLIIGIIFLLFGAALIALNTEMHARKREAAALAAAERAKEAQEE